MPTILKKILTIITLTFICACAQKDKIVNPNEIFNEQEIADLNLILDKFDKTLLTEFNTNSKEKAYSDFSNYILGSNEIPMYDGFQELSNRLSDLSIFDEIWIKTENGNNGDLKTINLNPEEKFFDYLKALGEDSELIKNYKERVENTYDIQPSVVGGISKNFNDLNLKNPNHRLFLAIHYLTLINR